MGEQHRAFKFRIYPNPEQQVLLAKTFGCVRLVYNHYLDIKTKTYEESGKSLSYTKCAADLTVLKKEMTFLQEVDSIALQQTLRHLDTAFQNFFRDKKVGYPKFKSKKQHHYSYSTVCVNNNMKLENGVLTLPKIGKVRAKQHRIIPEGYILKSVTVSRTSTGKYFASILYEYHTEISMIEKPNHVVGLDFSIPELYVSANNIDANVIHHYEASLKKLQKAQRILSHCVPGSHNYEKQRIKVAKIHERIANQRYDYLHKKSTQIANAYDAICIEDVSIPEIVQDLPYRPVHRTIYDDGWGMFSNLVEYKMKDRGKYLLKADKSFPSSQRCHCCGYIHSELKLSDRKWTCPCCGAVHNRDKNAAINLKMEGERLLRECIA